MRSVQDLEAIINEGLRTALMEETPDRSLKVLLEHLGKALNGERTYIFEQNGSGGDDNTYEWVADGVEPEQENLQNVPPEVCASWYRNFSIGRHIVIESVEDIRESEPLQYENLKRQGIHSLVVVPLYDGERIIGFYGVDDPPVKSLEYASNMLQTAAYFIVSSLKRRDLFRALQKRSYLEGRQSLEGILEGARTGIWTIELEDGCPPRMYADRTMRILLGVPDGIGPEECYRHWSERIEPDYVEMVRETVEEMLKTGRAEVIYPWDHPELGKIYVRCGGVPDKTFAKPGACLNGYHQDITETMVTRKKQEQSIMELLERVRRANSAKSEFLSHMSHDLRTPINGILGMLAILEKSQDDPERQRDCRRKIRVSAEHLLSLVNDVLQVSNLESGKPAAAAEPFDLRTVLEDCVTILSPLAEERDVLLELETSGLRHSRAIGDPLRLKQVLMGVIDNALKYNRPHGSVSVRAEEAAFRDGTVRCRFTIEDTGIGIGEDFKDHIFEPFTQEHQGARTDYNGAGLGMSIVKRLVDQMEGTIEVDSRVGKGSVVRIVLPIRADPAGEARFEEKERGDIAGMQVLLAEDNEINCEIVEFMLRDAGAEVVTAKDGKAAVDAFEASASGTFDCILMDLMMPVMSGYEAARVIRGLDRADARSVPIIALSANAFEADIALAKDAGMDAHLAKPVDIHRMFQVMSRLRA
ncbi:GAF domain-containing hybrid sensor histidine kinase/response regulator [uncultured Oscillibacter sp.]|uniref:GAF domain-containing hybrid sensor histidine kinase/response regulator n=1 Tax=uncultured Oscillibacter sp. TaxID=876091 RepID=UPI0025F95642|nr:GAF domain-containing hybrid sensor histidine kinase/response regulator [uncultured Oscillibacter sp.]